MSTKQGMSAAEIAKRMSEAYGGDTNVNLRAIERYVQAAAYRLEYNRRPENIAKRKTYMAKRAAEAKQVRAMIRALQAGATTTGAAEE